MFNPLPRHAGLAATIFACGLVLAATAVAQQRERFGLRQPVYRVAQLGTNPAVVRPSAPVRQVAAPLQAAAPQFAEVAQVQAQAPAQPQPPAQAQAADEHPLQPVIKYAQTTLDRIQAEQKDYTCTLVKRERIDGVLGAHQYIHTKVRNQKLNERGEVIVPFSVYMYFMAPDTVKGREVIYVAGRNDGKLIAHDGGTGLIAALKSSVTVNLLPDSAMAMQGQKYPITDVGMENLMRKLVEVATMDLKHGEVEVKSFKGTKINGRTCTCLQSIHPVPREHFRYHVARIYVDDELQLPIRYESYGWPTREGEEAPLLEEYTYLNLKLNQGLTDADFDRANGNYNFN